MNPVVVMLQLFTTTAHQAVGRVRRRHGAAPGDDAGLSTLEVVVIALGLFLIAGVLVAAITVAVQSRLGQIN